MVYIKKGKLSIAGTYIDYGWSVYSTGSMPTHWPSIRTAKSKAVELGASGKWRREVKPVGVRGRGIVHYYDAEAK